MTFALTSCTAVHWLDARGEVRTLGLGRVEAVTADGGIVTRLSAPGLSLRLVPSGWRYGIGWIETTLFQSVSTDRPRELLAIGDRAYGVMLDPGGVMIGTERRFVVLEPDHRTPLVQEIRYSSGRPSHASLYRREVE